MPDSRSCLVVGKAVFGKNITDFRFWQGVLLSAIPLLRVLGFFDLIPLFCPLCYSHLVSIGLRNDCLVWPRDGDAVVGRPAPRVIVSTFRLLRYQRAVLPLSASHSAHRRLASGAGVGEAWGGLLA